MYNRTEIKEVLDGKLLNKEVTVCGWVRAFRVTDSLPCMMRFTSFNTIQIVVDFEKEVDPSVMKKSVFHACICAKGSPD
ncbi:MAG: hypothetical protein R2769_17415 [Saprospiraceae bacterium]